MAINRFSQSAPMEWRLPKTPLEPLGYALEQKQQRYDTAYALADELADQQIQALQQDRARANELTRGWNTRIDDMVTQYEGDYSRMYKDLGALKRDINRTMGAGGEGHAIETNRSNFYNWLEEQQKRLAKGEIMQAQLQHGADYYRSGYKGVGEQDPVTGNYNLLQPDQLAKYTNPDDFLHEALKNVAADKGGSLVSRPDGFYIVTEGGKYERIGEDRIQNIAAQTLMNNPEYVNLMTQMSSHMGADPYELMTKDIAERATRMGNIYRKDDNWYERTLKGDPMAVKMWEMQQIQSMMNPDGLTMPSRLENSKLSSSKIKLDKPRKYTSQKGGSGRYPSYSTLYDTDKMPTSAELISTTRNKIQKETPALSRAFDATVKQVQTTAAYKNGSTEEQQKILADAWNRKVDKVQTVSGNDIVFDAQTLPGIQALWKNGMARAAQYRKVNKDGSLGSPQKFEEVASGEKEQKALLATAPLGLTPHSEASGGKLFFGNNEYVVTGTQLDTPSSKYLRPVGQMREPLISGKVGTVAWDGMPYLTEENGEFVYKQAPEKATMRFTLGDDAERIGEIVDANGRVIDIVPVTGVDLAEGEYVKKAAAEIPRNSQWHANYLKFGDPNRQYDQ